MKKTGRTRYALYFSMMVVVRAQAAGRHKLLFHPAMTSKARAGCGQAWSLFKTVIKTGIRRYQRLHIYGKASLRWLQFE